MDQPKKQRGGRKRNSKAKAEKDEPKIPRPYTSWLIYFQLEREWILQKKLGVASSIDPEKVFVATDPRYNGPPLPSRYQDLALPSDWWVPGKGDRRKRLHRKSHGLFSFHELSRMIKDSWAEVDTETRAFCDGLSEISMNSYREAKREFKQSPAVPKSNADDSTNKKNRDKELAAADAADREPPVSPQGASSTATNTDGLCDARTPASTCANDEELNEELDDADGKPAELPFSDANGNVSPPVPSTANTNTRTVIAMTHFNVNSQSQGQFLGHANLTSMSEAASRSIIHPPFPNQTFEQRQRYHQFFATVQAPNTEIEEALINMYMFHLETKVKTAYNYKESKGNHNRFQTVNMADNDIRRMWNDRTNSTVESEDSDEPLAIIDDINAKTEETNENIEEKKVTEETGDEFKSYLDTLYLDGVTD
ncbi:predicted protein [Thalassiosira pseudonana CCMP1335]|uniref:HMG box domain-containing protein n=1 Tax=Thalassiosira pseudonana TaxID=35128 RepID=B5YM79_THAPS|nr:predicted protein [Thalassiosira pseudonana CCMP1335]ACI64365.1 predicted protein [Thalassiosira pseudonana CCMP1335]